jgi:hypothetical protein
LRTWSGTVGVALLAFRAVGGIESGITYGERYDVNPLIKPPTNNDPFSPSPRVYIERLGTFSRATRPASCSAIGR